MDKQEKRFFIALLPPENVQQFANKIKQKFAEVYKSSAALKSPPHITLQPPFTWQQEGIPRLHQSLKEFAQTQAPIPMTLQGFGVFKPHVIYINVLKTPELLDIQRNLRSYLELSLEIVHEISKQRPYSPHLTVAYRDLTKPNFYQAWAEFEHQPLQFEFVIPQVALLIHTGKQWQIQEEFSLSPAII